MSSRAQTEAETYTDPGASTRFTGPPLPAGTLAVGRAEEDWSGDARYFEYSQAADPIAAGFTRAVPVATFEPSLHLEAPTGLIPLDLSASLGIDGAATSPALLASFVRIRRGEALRTAPTATSELYFVMAGAGSTTVDDFRLEWSEGDFLTLPGGRRSEHCAGDTDATLYWVTDEPLLRYLGVVPSVDRFSPTLFPAWRVRAELAAAAAAPEAGVRSRVSVLLANAAQSQTLTVTHVLWAMYGVVPAGAIQRPHRHQSVALDLCVGAEAGCFTLLGDEVDGSGAIVDPIRIDWVPGGAFTTPPGMWHSHHNESGSDAWVIPVQDAGLQTYLRSLDIRFGDAPST